MTATNQNVPGESKAEKSSNEDTATSANMTSTAHSAVDPAASTLEEAEYALQQASKAAGYSVFDAAAQAQDISRDVLGTVKAYMHLYPLRSVGMGVAIGYLLGGVLKK